MNVSKLSKASISIVAFVAVFWLVISGAALAQSGDTKFTLTSKNNPITSIGGDGKNGIPYSGWHWTGNSTRETSDGKKTESTYSCVMMSQPPKNTLFQLHMLCDLKASDGTFSSILGCTLMDPATTELSCVGALLGSSGAYADRRGNMTLHAKDGVSTGTGQWFE